MTIQLLPLPIDLMFEYGKENFGKISGLAQYLLSFPPEKISAFALVPKETLINRALEFERGGLFSSNEPQQWLLERLNDQSERCGGGTCIVQDIWMKISDRMPFLSTIGAAMFGHDGSPYYWLGSADFSYDKIRDTFGASRGFQILAAFTSRSLDKNKISADNIIDNLTFNTLLEGVQELYMRAYDEESFFILQLHQ
jgi:hypothetical protein